MGRVVIFLIIAPHDYTLTHLMISFLLITIYDSSMEQPSNHVVRKFLLEGLKCYTVTQMKAYEWPHCLDLATQLAPRPSLAL